MRTLPSVPDTIPVLSSIDSDWIKSKYQGLSSDLAKCVTCRGRGTFRWRGPDGEPADWRCDCPGQFKLHRYMLSCGIDLHYQRLGWDDVDGIPVDVMTTIDKYIQNFDNYIAGGIGMLLWGMRGTGKSLLATLLLKDLLAKGVRGQFITFNYLIDYFTKGWKEEAHAVWFENRARNARLLVIDDIGREYGGRGEIAEAMLDQILRFRVAAELPTIITTNRKPDELHTLYSGNALSLLSEASITQEFRGEDYRPRNQIRRSEDAEAGLVRPIIIG
jgi:DNA replication protein DnaC